MELTTWQWLAFAPLFVLLLAHLPVWPVIRLLTMPIPDRGSAVACMLGAWVRGMLMLPADLLAPVVVPVALLFTRWEDDSLPGLFCWWDNDASINGDVRTDDPNDSLGGWALKPVPLEDTPEARAMCYWAPGHHPRSFYARWVWLGLRNRASRLAQLLGTDATGTPAEWSEGLWSVHRLGDAWRYYEAVPIGPVLLRFHYGYKIPRLPGQDLAPVVSIGFSAKRAPKS